MKRKLQYAMPRVPVQKLPSTGRSSVLAKPDGDPTNVCIMAKLIARKRAAARATARSSSEEEESSSSGFPWPSQELGEGLASDAGASEGFEMQTQTVREEERPRVVGDDTSGGVRVKSEMKGGPKQQFNSLKGKIQRSLKGNRSSCESLVESKESSDESETEDLDSCSPASNAESGRRSPSPDARNE